MSATTPAQNRRSRRSNLFMAAAIVRDGQRLDVRLRNLSREGALIEGDQLPAEGAAVIFLKGELEVPGTIAWTSGRRAGISFADYLDPESVLRHVPTPKARPSFQSARPSLKIRP